MKIASFSLVLCILNFVSSSTQPQASVKNGTLTTTLPLSPLSIIKGNGIKKFTIQKNDGPVPLHQFQHKITGIIFFTTNLNELGQDISAYNYEGTIGKIYETSQTGTVPLFRFTRTNGNGDNVYTSDWSQIAKLDPDYDFKSVTGFVSEKMEDDLIPLYRFYSKDKGHLYVVNPNPVKNKLVGYKMEAIEAYIWPSHYDQVSINVEDFLVIRQEFSRQLDDMSITLVKLEKTLENQKREIDHLKKDPVPLGFVFTQYPDQPRPDEIWPTVRWLEVTGLYAGLFFRAGGGGAADSGGVQEENNSRIDQIHFTYCNNENTTIGKCPEIYDISVPRVEGWSEPIVTGNYKKAEWNAWEYVKFHSTGGEVRPKNRAIKIFKRIG